MRAKVVGNGKALVVDDPVPDLRPHLKEHNGKYWLPNRFDAYRMLRNAGCEDMPRYADQFYDWPAPFIPAEHQRETTEFLLYQQRAWCLNGMRTGKTACAIWAMDILMRLKMIERVLIISPLSVVRDAWMRALISIVPGRDYAEATGASRKVAGVLEAGHEIVVANHDKVKWNFNDVIEFNPDLVIIDEASVFKGYDSDRYKALRGVVNKTQPRLWALTATPTGNNPENVYPMAKLINPDAVPLSPYAWRNKVMVPIGDGSQQFWVPRNGWEEEVKKVLTPAIRFRTKDCIDMPPVVVIERLAPMSAKQEKAYKQMKREGRADVADGQITAMNAAIKLSKLLQITSGLAYDRRHNVVKVDASNKLHELLDVIYQTDDNVLVFTPFVHVMHYVHDALDEQGVSCAILTSKSSLTRRQETFNLFQSRELKVLVMHPDVARYGLTLTAASTTVWWGPIFNVETFTQANLRMQGPGKGAMSIVLLHANELEQNMFTKLQQGEDTHTIIADTYRRAV